MSKRYRFEVDYEDDLEWGLGPLKEHGEGFDTTGPEVAKVLRELADHIERRFPGEFVPVAYANRDAS